MLMWQADPETGAGADLIYAYAQREYEVKLKSDSNTSVYCLVVGNAEHQWLISGNDPALVFELDGSKCIERETMPADYARMTRSCFVLNDRLFSVIERVAGQRELFQLIDDHWTSMGEIELLDTNHRWTTDTGQDLVDAASIPVQYYATRRSLGAPGSIKNTPQFGHSSLGTVRVLSIGSTAHVFWRIDNRLLYRRGIDLIPIVPQPPGSASILASVPAPVSALEPENAVGIAHGWSVVIDLSEPNDGTWFPVAVGGEPAVILTPSSHESSMPVSAKRIEQGHWTEFASTTLPFLSIPVTSGSRDDGSSAYLVVATRMGRTQTLALEPAGFRLTRFHHVHQHLQSISGYFLLPVLLTWGQICAAVLALTAALIMRKDHARYEFGLQAVASASLLRRGLARLIDLVLIIGSTAALFWTLQAVFTPDWLTVFEAINIKIYNHPPVILATRIMVACAIWLCLVTMATITLQGVFGFTPGKWLLGLRTVRTTLRPVGFARSLLRELLFYFDTAALLCWAPGILFITYTHNRQRMGDMIADTIVINSSRNS